jgi:hypothetical protein
MVLVWGLFVSQTVGGLVVALGSAVSCAVGQALCFGYTLIDSDRDSYVDMASRT